MSVLETVTVDNVTYDMHDPKVGSGTLSTTAKTLIPAVNELVTPVSKIGSGALNTTAQTLIPAVNEINSKGVTWGNIVTAVKDGTNQGNYTFTASSNGLLFAAPSDYTAATFFKIVDSTAGITYYDVATTAAAGTASRILPIIKGHTYSVQRGSSGGWTYGFYVVIGYFG